MKNFQLSPAKGLALSFLVIYAFFAIVPAAAYRASLGDSPAAPPASPQPGGVPAENASVPAESTPVPAESPSLPAESAPAPSPQPPADPPGFLDGFNAPGASALPGETAAGPGESPKEKEAVFTLHDAADGSVLEVPEREFLEAALACEMDLSSPEEALKAQAVAAYTYYCRQREDGVGIACDTGRWLVYVPESAMRERWGEDYEAYKKILAQAVDQVFGQRLTYQGRTALAAYFAISPGSTEAVENVWSPDANVEHPYLQAVASPGDQFSDGYLSQADFTPDQFREAALAAFPDNPPDLSAAPEDWLADITYTPSGMVKTAVLGGREVSGAQLRTAFGLRSAGFQVEYAEGAFHFTVRGWGHGVGMSQAGAVFMAKGGAGYREILAHYYPGTELTPSEVRTTAANPSPAEPEST